MQKNGSCERIGTVVEMRPDKLSYLVDVQGKMLVRARYMLQPVQGEVSDESELQVQGGAHNSPEVGVLPRRSEHLKDKVNTKSVQKCVLPMLTMPSSGSIGDLTNSTELSSSPKRCMWSQNPTPSARTQEASPLLMSSGQALPLWRRQFLTSQSSLSPSSSLAGWPPKGSDKASIVIRNSFPPLPLSWDHGRGERYSELPWLWCSSLRGSQVG